MLITNPIPNTIDYCCNDMPYAQCGERCVLTREQAEAGLNPLATVPAQSWGYLWNATNEAIHCIKYAARVLIDEINTVLCCAGVTPNPSCSNQLYQALDNIFRVVGTAEKAGSVKSSSVPGEVSIDQTTGIMTANCVGNASQLATVCTEITGAINELKANYDTVFSSIWDVAGCRDAEKADNDHASVTTAYGVGNASCYGHLMITDTCDCNCGNAGMVASQKAVYDIWYKVAHQAALGNTTPANLGNAASAGTCDTAARSDHVHCDNILSVCCIDRVGICTWWYCAFTCMYISQRWVDCYYKCNTCSSFISACNYDTWTVSHGACLCKCIPWLYELLQRFHPAIVCCLTCCRYPSMCPVYIYGYRCYYVGTAPAIISPSLEICDSLQSPHCGIHVVLKGCPIAGSFTICYYRDTEHQCTMQAYESVGYATAAVKPAQTSAILYGQAAIAVY